MALVDHATGAVTVEKVDGKEESFWEQLEGSVSFNKEVEQIGAHEPLYFGLNVNGVDIGQRLRLQIVSHDSSDDRGYKTDLHEFHMIHNVILVLIGG
jgi:hypothetical protein